MSANLNDKQVAKLSEVLPYYQKVFERAYAGSSRTAGIKAFCLDCVGFVRSDITNCTAHACPLYPYRPYQAGESEEGDETEGQILPDAAAVQESATTTVKPDEAVSK